MEDRDYVTILPAVHPPAYWCVVLMRHQGQGEYVSTRCSFPRPKSTALQIAELWGRLHHAEVRL